MKKLKLNLEEIKVESFETNSVIKEKGTVIGQETFTIPISCELCGAPTSPAAGCKFTLQVECTNQTCGDVYTCRIEDPC